jgi:exodeoxyribonuclease VII small subunit
MKAITELSFEEAYAELENLIAQLTSGELTLETSVQHYERGRELSAYCQRLLDTAELRINRLSDAGTLSPL